jgi:hypothetical protein
LAERGGKQGGLWGEKFRQWHEDQEYFFKHYYQRSNVETTIMMWKTSFGDNLRSRTQIAMKNELTAVRLSPDRLPVTG